MNIDVFVFLLLLIVLVAGVVLVICLLRARAEYYKSDYSQQTDHSYWEALTDKGVRGEFHTATLLNPFRFQSARVLYNLYIPTYNDHTTEIDAVLITHSGVFVIETKYRSGWIFGNADQKYWYQTLPTRYGSEKNQFYNSIWQNGTHIRFLRNLIPRQTPYFSVVVFSDNCTLKQVSTEGSQAYVVYARDLQFLIQRALQIERPCLSDTDIQVIYNTLLTYDHADEATKMKHRQQVYQEHRDGGGDC